jgi:hypothetical protein
MRIFWLDEASKGEGQQVRKSWKAGSLYAKNINCWQTDRHDDYYRAPHLRCGALIMYLQFSVIVMSPDSLLHCTKFTWPKCLYDRNLLFWNDGLVSTSEIWWCPLSGCGWLWTWLTIILFYTHSQYLLHNNIYKHTQINIYHRIFGVIHII